MAEEKKRLEYLDVARGILIILAVIGHIWQAGYVHNAIYVFHMPAFFVISGMLLSVTQSYKKGCLRFVARRIYSFGIPFLFIELLGVLSNIMRFGVTLNWKGYLYNTLTQNFNDPNLWFLEDLFLIEVLFAGLLCLLKKDWAVIAAAAALVAASYVCPKEVPAVVALLFSLHRYLTFFVIGYYGFRILSKPCLPAALLCAAAVFVIAAVFGKRADSGLSWKNAAIFAGGLMGTYAVLQIGRLSLGALGRILAAAGRNTIIIYGTHHIIYLAVGVLLGVTDYKTTPLWAGLIMLAVLALLEPPIIYVINRWLPFLAGKHYPKRKAE